MNTRIKGKGEVLLLLHGNNEESTFFVNQIDYFSKNYTVIALDTRGHGNTPRGCKSFTIRQFVEDLHDYINEFNIKKCHILGFSDGGNIALLFAVKYPEFVDKLIIVGANLNPRGVKVRFQLITEVQYYSQLIFNRKSKECEMLRLMVNDPNINKEDLRLIQSPTLVIAGTHDEIKDSHTRLIASLIPNSTLCFVEGDHYVANKNHKEFNFVVDDFLKM